MVVVVIGGWRKGSGWERTVSTSLPFQLNPLHPTAQPSEPSDHPGTASARPVSRLVPFGHVFGPLLSPFRTKFTRYSKSLCKKHTKTSYNTRYPLGTKYYKERGISKLLGRRCQNHSANDAVRARAKGPCLRGRTETAFTPYKRKEERGSTRLTR